MHRKGKKLIMISVTTLQPPVLKR